MAIIPGKINFPKAALIIEQYEELIAKGCKEDDRNRFIRVLKILLEADQNDLFKIIITVSPDFQPQWHGPEFEQYWQKGTYVVPSLNAGELREIILMPTMQVVMEFEPPNFIETLFEDFKNAPWAIPILSFILNELFQSYKDRGARAGFYVSRIIKALKIKKAHYINIPRKLPNLFRLIMKIGKPFVKS